MKIAFLGDLHLDFANFNFYDDSKIADVLLLCGDVAEYDELKIYPQFFIELVKRFDKVYAVKGNHEIYGSDLLTIDKDLREFYSQFGIEYLNREVAIMPNGMQLLGATLWSDFDKANPTILLQAPRRLADYVTITNNGERLTPDIILGEHYKDLDFIKNFDSNSPYVVMTHHAPLIELDLNFPDITPISFLFCSDLYQTIIDKPNLKHWVSGHIHKNQTIDIGNGQFVHSQSRGYPKEKIHKAFLEDSIKIIEV